ncbi:MAG: hypothetical protein VZR53_14170 [Prevotella sp.]|nr:hypothetical protein [Prevotella sp.]
MESLFDAWGKKNPEWEKKYAELLMEPFTDYGRGTSQYTVSRGKIFGAGYEMFIIGFFIGLYFDKTRKLPDDKSKRKDFGHPIMFWGSQEGKLKLGRTSYKKIQEYMFAALVAKTDIDFISLEKGEISVNDAANSLKHKMEEYANYGFHYLEDMLEDDPNSLFKESAFLKIFTSFISEDNKKEDDIENFEEDIESFGDEELEDNAIDEETLRAEAEKPWNEDEIERLSLFFKHGMEPSKLAERLGKSLYSVQYQLSKLGLIRMPLNVTVNNTENGGTVINKSGKVIYTDDAPLKVFNDKIYRFNKKSVCMTVKDVKRVDGQWVKGDKMLVAYSDSELYPNLSSSNFIDDIEDFVEGNKREENKVKVKGVWYDYYGDVLGSKSR